MLSLIFELDIGDLYEQLRTSIFYATWALNYAG